MPVKKSIVIKIYTLYLNLTLAHTYLRTFSKNDIVHSWHFRWYEISDFASFNSNSMKGIQLRSQGRNEIILPCVGKHIFFSMLKMFSIDSWATLRPISNWGSWPARARPSERRSWKSKLKAKQISKPNRFLVLHLTAWNKMDDFFVVVQLACGCLQNSLLHFQSPKF